MANKIGNHFNYHIKRENKTLSYKEFVNFDLFGTYKNFGPKRSYRYRTMPHKALIAKLNEATVRMNCGNISALCAFLHRGYVIYAVRSVLFNLSSITGLMNYAVLFRDNIHEYDQKIDEAIYWQRTFLHSHLKLDNTLSKLCPIESQIGWRYFEPNLITDGTNKSYEFYCNEVK